METYKCYICSDDQNIMRSKPQSLRNGGYKIQALELHCLPLNLSPSLSGYVTTLCKLLKCLCFSFTKFKIEIIMFL